MGPPPQVAKNPVKFAFLHNKFNCPGPGSIFQFFAFCAFIFHFGLAFTLALWAFISFHFGLLGLHFCLFWPFGPSFPFILAFWAFISFHFGLVGLHFLSFWRCGPSFLFILAFWALISFYFGLLGLHFLSFWPSGPSFPFVLALWWLARGGPPTSCQKPCEICIFT